MNTYYIYYIKPLLIKKSFFFTSAENVSVIMRVDSHLQEETSLFFANLSSSLLHMAVDNSEKVHLAASSLVEGASHILDYPSSVSV